MSILNLKYPHLLPVDIPCWEAFLRVKGHEFTRFEYDIRVGDGADVPLDYPEPMRKMVNDLSKKRIDAVGFTASAIYTIEITRHAGLKAIGQLISYPILYRHSYPTIIPIIPLLVAEDLITDIKLIIIAMDIPIWLSGANPTAIEAPH